MRCDPSNPKGLVTTAMVNAPPRLGNFGYDGGRTCARTAAHSGSNENHFRAIDYFFNFIAAFFGCFMSDSVVATGA